MEKTIFELIYGLTFVSETLDLILVFFAKQMPYLVVLLPFLFFKSRLAIPFLGLLAGGIARFGLVDLIRSLFFRERPFIIEGIVPLFDHAPTASFPSGHAAFFFALSAVIFLYDRKIGYLFFSISFFMVLARVASGVHWPLDILAGAVLGVLIGWFVWVMAQKWIPERYLRS